MKYKPGNFYLLITVLLVSPVAIYGISQLNTFTPNSSADKEQIYLGLSNLVGENPAEVNNSNLPITSTEMLHFTGSAPRVDITQYRLTIDGLVDTHARITYDELLKYPAVTRVVLLICPNLFADNAEWTGVPIATLLAEAGVKKNARELVFYALDGYEVTLTLEEALSDGVFLAYYVNGQTLPWDHGYPLRLVVKGHYGDKWVKWVEHIEVR